LRAHGDDRIPKHHTYQAKKIGLTSTHSFVELKSTLHLFSFDMADLHSEGTNSIILLLNGASSSGKTSLANAIQSFDKKRYTVASIDSFIKEKIQDYTHVINLNNHIVQSLLNAFNQHIQRLALSYDLVIVDHVLGEKKAWIDQLNADLKLLTTYRIKIFCAPTELIKRENLRTDRPADTTHALRQEQEIHRHFKYDLSYDTQKESYSQIAKQVLAHLAQKHPSLTLSPDYEP